MIVGDVVDPEFAGVDVAQYQVGGAGDSDRGNACELPVQTDIADLACEGDLIDYVVEEEFPGVRVAKDDIAFRRGCC